MNNYESFEEFYMQNREKIKNSSGLCLIDFKKSLKPKLWLNWINIISGYAFIFILTWVASKTAGLSKLIELPVILASSICAGYAFAFINLFFHEAAHYNLASSKKKNDLLADIFIGLLVGVTIKQYRIVHFDHHRFHGTTMDTETSYFDPLNTNYFLEALFAIKTFKVITSRKKQRKTNERKSSGFLFFIFGLAANLVVLISLTMFLNKNSAIVWFLAVICFFPFFASLRQILEHRDEEAETNKDYKTLDHGKINRLFGDSLISKTFGSAGFNRHLLHHLEPQISCTNLKELELFLKDSLVKNDINKNTTSYPSIFLKLLSQK